MLGGRLLVNELCTHGTTNTERNPVLWWASNYGANADLRLWMHVRQSTQAPRRMQGKSSNCARGSPCATPSSSMTSLARQVASQQGRSPVCGENWLYCCKACCRLLTCEVLDAAYHAFADLWAFAAKDERSESLRWLFGSGTTRGRRRPPLLLSSTDVQYANRHKVIPGCVWLRLVASWLRLVAFGCCWLRLVPDLTC
jgi:hypothetical protein